MKKSLTMLTIAATTSALVAGCASPQMQNMSTGQRTGVGAGLGALVGAGIGQAVGRDSKSTLIGAAAGAALGAGAGYVWSQRMEQQRLAMEQAAQGTPVQVSQTADNRLRINIPALNETSLGELFYMMEFECGVSGYLLGVNPFNQPGVESYKHNMFALLGKPGFEKEHDELTKRL